MRFAPVELGGDLNAQRLPVGAEPAALGPGALRARGAGSQVCGAFVQEGAKNVKGPSTGGVAVFAVFAGTLRRPV